MSRLAPDVYLEEVSSVLGLSSESQPQWRRSSYGGSEDMKHLSRLAACAAALAALSMGSAPSAQAADPPDSWTNQRVLSCDGAPVETYLTPAGFGGAFHVVGTAGAAMRRLPCSLAAPDR